MEYAVSDADIEIQYYYTDIYIITLIALGVRIAQGATVQAASKLRDKISVGMSNQKVAVAKGLFIPAADPKCLLALIGLHSERENSWRFNALRVIAERYLPGAMGELPAPVEKLRQTTATQLRKAAG